MHPKHFQPKIKASLKHQRLKQYYKNWNTTKDTRDTKQHCSCAEESCPQTEIFQQSDIRGFMCMKSRIYATVFQEIHISNTIFYILTRSNPLWGKDSVQLLSEIFECFPGIQIDRTGSCVFKHHPSLQILCSINTSFPREIIIPEQHLQICVNHPCGPVSPWSLKFNMK